jgi:hypothetical protein
MIDGADLRPCLTCLLNTYLGSAPSSMSLRGEKRNGIGAVFIPHDHEADVDGDLSAGDIHGSMGACKSFSGSFAPHIHATRTHEGFLVEAL